MFSRKVLKAFEGELLSKPHRPLPAGKQRTGGDLWRPRKQFLIPRTWPQALPPGRAPAAAAVLHCSLYVAAEPSSAPATTATATGKGAKLRQHGPHRATLERDF